jgi:hypothetical protein
MLTTRIDGWGLFEPKAPPQLTESNEKLVDDLLHFEFIVVGNRLLFEE